MIYSEPPVPPPSAQHLKKIREGAKGIAALAKAQPVPPKPKQAPKEETGNDDNAKVLTLAAILQHHLSQKNPHCIFIVRHINKLGWKAPRKLKAFFSSYGPVVRVLVARSTVRQSYQPDAWFHRRPSSLGFVQMRTAQAVQAILAMGAEQQINGAMISVQQFSSMPHDEASFQEGMQNDEAALDFEEDDMPEDFIQEPRLYTSPPPGLESVQPMVPYNFADYESAPTNNKLLDATYSQRLECETTTGSDGISDEDRLE